MEILTIRARQSGYSAQQAMEESKPITVGELRAYLEDFDEDAPVLLHFDGKMGMYGSVTERGLDSEYIDDEDE